MYRISEDIADFLLYSRKSPQVPGLLKDEFKPFVQRNTHTIGFINPIVADGSDSKFLVELMLPDIGSIEEMEAASERPENRSWWIYQRSEFTPPAEPFEVERHMVDKNYSGSDKLDITDCTLVVPAADARPNLQVITNIEQLYEIFPALKDCIDPEKEVRYGSHSQF